MRAATGHEFVVIDPVEELRQIYIDNELIAVGDIGLRLRHRLLGRASGPEAVTVLAERRVPQRLKPLEHRLLDDAIDHGRNAESTPPATPGLWDHHPAHRLRLVAPLE
jgi:site-specific DNA recombinase